MQWTYWCGWAPLLCAALLIGGCGRGDSTQHFDVSGSVTLGGKPVPEGVILFEPDASKSNHGPAGFATIKDGKYDTAVGGKGTVGGPHVVRINGSEAFADYVTNIDLPKEKGTHDFEVPGSAKLPPRSRPGPDYRGP